MGRSTTRRRSGRDRFPRLWRPAGDAPAGPEGAVLRWSMSSLGLAIVFAVFGSGGLAQESAIIARILAGIGCVLAILAFLSHWQRRKD